MLEDISVKTNFFSHQTTRVPARVPAHLLTGPSSFSLCRLAEEIEAKEETGEEDENEGREDTEHESESPLSCLPSPRRA